MEATSLLTIYCQFFKLGMYPIAHLQSLFLRGTLAKMVKLLKLFIRSFMMTKIECFCRQKLTSNLNLVLLL